MPNSSSTEHPYPRERTWSDCETEVKRLRDELAVWEQRYVSVDDVLKAKTREAEIERLRDELRERLSQDILDDALEEWKKENERLREENALLTKGWQPATPTALLDEIARLRGLLQEALENGHIRVPYGASHEDVAAILDFEKRIKEAI